MVSRDAALRPWLHDGRMANAEPDEAPLTSVGSLVALFDVADRVGRARQRMALMQTALAASRAAGGEDVIVVVQRCEVLYRLGWEYAARSDTVKAREAYEEAVTLGVVVAQTGEHGLRRRGLAAKAEAMVGLGDLVAARGDVASAQALFEQSLALFEEVSRADPGNTGYRREIAVGLARLGGLAAARGDVASAQALFEQSRALFEGLSRADPENTGEHRVPP